jgi:FkbH-like protein
LLSEELQLGLDSFIFIDDSPVECMEVKSQCPEVLTLCLPQQDEDIKLYLKNIWVLDQRKTTKIDHGRTELYKENIRRNKYKKEALSYREFLKGLELEVEISLLEDEDITRGAQLTQRVNQFNFTTKRYTEAELKNLCINPSTSCYTVKAKDRFGDYGLVGLIVCIEEDRTLRIDNFLLSCRAIGRGIEYQIFARLGEIAREKNLESIYVNFIESCKNQPAKQFLALIGHEYVAYSNESISYDFPVDFIEKLRFESYINVTEICGKEVDETSEQIASSVEVPILDILDDIGRNLNTAKKIHSSIVRFIQDKAAKRQNYVEPTNEIEKEIVRIWEDVLSINKIGIMDNFFELGGESIKAIQILSRMREVFQVELPITILFQGSITVIDMAEAVELALLSSVDDDLLAKELAAIENLSDEEIELMLSEQEEV